MKRLLTLGITMLLGAGLAFAQGTAGSTGTKKSLNPQPLPPGQHAAATPDAATKSKKGEKKGHKGGKKSKKGSAGSSTPPPK